MGTGSLVYLQMWSEFRGKNDLVAFDESGEVRTLFPAEDGGFVTGPGVAVPDPIESRAKFDHDASGRVVSLGWQRGNSVARTARRIENEKREDISFANRDIYLAGTLICPLSPGTPRDRPCAGIRRGRPRISSSVCPFSNATEWRCLDTTSAGWAVRPATGRLNRSMTWRAMRSPPSSF